MHSAHSTACTALHTQPILGGAPHLAGGGANPRRVLHGFAGRRKLPGRHIRCASGAPQRATLARTALMRRSLRWLCRLLIAAVLADVALCGAPDAHLVCLPGSNLLPAGSHSPLLGVAIQKRSHPCPALAQYCMYGTQTAVHTQLFVLHYAMHSTRWTDLHAWHCMHSTACTAQCHAQHYVHSVTSSTALRAQHYMHSPAWTALHAQHCIGVGA